MWALGKLCKRGRKTKKNTLKESKWRYHQLSSTQLILTSVSYLLPRLQSNKHTFQIKEINYYHNINH